MTVAQKNKIEILYHEMFEKMRIYACCSLKNELLAEEAVQETFHIACQKPEQLCESVNPQGWLVQTLKYVICNIKSSQATSKRILDEHILIPSPENIASEDIHDLHTLYGSMADTEEFKLLVEFAIEGKSHLEMASSRGISVDTCKKRMQRAKESLQKKMKD